MWLCFMYKKVIFATLFFLLIQNLNASESNILDIDIQNIQYKNNVLEFDMMINIDRDWKLYSNQKSDFGIPLNIKILKNNVIINNDITYPPSNKEVKILSGEKYVSNIFSNNVLLKIKLNLKL